MQAIKTAWTEVIEKLIALVITVSLFVMQRGGEGEFRSSDGTFYTGGWSKDLINGPGRMEYSNGDCYNGNWFKNTVSTITY